MTWWSDAARSMSRVGVEVANPAAGHLTDAGRCAGREEHDPTSARVGTVRPGDECVSQHRSATSWPVEWVAPRFPPDLTSSLQQSSLVKVDRHGEQAAGAQGSAEEHLERVRARWPRFRSSAVRVTVPVAVIRASSTSAVRVISGVHMAVSCLVVDGSQAGEQVWSRLSAARLALERETSPAYDEVLVEVSERVAASGSLGKSDIGALVLWKRIQANTRWAVRLMGMPDTEVRAVTRRAVDAVRDPHVTVPDAARRGRRELSALPGFTTGGRARLRGAGDRGTGPSGRLRPIGTRRADDAR